MAPSAQLTIRQALAIPSFRKLWMGQIVSIFGDFLALYAVLSEMSFRMHASPRAITLVTASYLLPFALIGPLAGVFVDRWDPKRTMVVSDLARAVLALGLVIAGAPWHIYLVFVVISAFSSFFMPARSVILPQIVPPTWTLKRERGDSTNYATGPDGESRDCRSTGRLGGAKFLLLPG